MGYFKVIPIEKESDAIELNEDTVDIVKELLGRHTKNVWVKPDETFVEDGSQTDEHTPGLLLFSDDGQPTVVKFGHIIVKDYDFGQVKVLVPEIFELLYQRIQEPKVQPVVEAPKVTKPKTTAKK